MQTIVNNTKNENMCCNMVALEEGEAEFATIGKKLKTFLSYDVVDFEDSPKEYLDILREDMGNQNATLEELKGFASAHFGGFDRTPDISLKDRKVNYTETIRKFDNGSDISTAEFTVLQHIEKDAKDIAELIFRTRSTVENQIASMKNKSGLTGKQLIAFAERKGYITCCF